MGKATLPVMMAICLPKINVSQLHLQNNELICYHLSMKNTSSFTKILSVSGLIIASVVLVGCSKVKEQVQNKVQETVQQAATQLLSEADLAKISDPLVRKNLVAQANVRAFRTVSSTNEKSAPGTTTEIQINGTSIGMHTITSIAGKNQEMIILGDTTYVKDPSDNTWWKQVRDSQASTAKTGPVNVPSLDEIKKEYTAKQENTVFKSLGTEACGTLTCYKYTETDGGDTTQVRTFWFDNKDFLTRKDEMSHGTLTITNTYSYDNISVQAPSPTKDVPAGHSAFEYMMGGQGMPAPAAAQGSAPTGSETKIPSQTEIDAMMKKAQDYQKQSAASSDGQ